VIPFAKAQPTIGFMPAMMPEKLLKCNILGSINPISVRCVLFAPGWIAETLPNEFPATDRAVHGFRGAATQLSPCGDHPAFPCISSPIWVIRRGISYLIIISNTVNGK